MTPKFCHQCGKKAEQGWKACPHCQTSLASLDERPKQHNTNRYNEPTVVEARDVDDEDYNPTDNMTHYQPRINQLEVEIDKPIQRKESIQSLANQPFYQDNPNEKRTAPPQISPEEALKQFQQEAGSIRQK